MVVFHCCCSQVHNGTCTVPFQDPLMHNKQVAPIIPSFDSHSVFSNYSPPFAEPNNQPNALSPATSQHSDAPSLPAGDSLERASRAADKGGLKNILTSAKGKVLDVCVSVIHTHV